MGIFNEKERVLANEASLTSSMLSSGLFALRRANMFQKGLYYQAFFSLSIGIERLLKMIVITKYRIENDGEFPDGDFLKIAGHNLAKLYESVGIAFQNEKIQIDIISFLSKFARSSRYYNLDSITMPKTHPSDPLAQWKIIQVEILQQVNMNKVNKISNKHILANLLDECTVIAFYDECGNEINGSIELLNEIERRDVIQGYSVQHVFQIIKKTVDLLRYIENKKYLLPCLSEFFAYYNDSWKAHEIRKKKNWMDISNA